ncbi:MAG: hypothetical protein ACD_10C00132G0001 [uncultured bacterium]|nr:MAG: hypothetical protein ACD_10C00132G0001 [uncultured bacterium]
MLKLLNDVVQIGLAAFDHATQCIGTVLIPLLVVQRLLIVKIGHRKSVTDALPKIVRAGC